MRSTTAAVIEDAPKRFIYAQLDLFLMVTDPTRPKLLRSGKQKDELCANAKWITYNAAQAAQKRKLSQIKQKN
jgi:hypothetical protein